MLILGDLSRAIYRNFQILFDVNGGPLSDPMVSGNPNLANSSCNTFIVILVVGVLHLKNSGHFVKLSVITKNVCSFYRTGIVNMKTRRRFVCLWPWIEFYGRCFCYRCAAFARFHHVFNVFIHTRPVYITLHESLHSTHYRVAGMEIFQNFPC